MGATPRPPGPASRFLFDRVLVQAQPDGSFVLSAPLDGAAGSAHWESEGAVLEDRGETAQLTPEGGPWTARAVLFHRGASPKVAGDERPPTEPRVVAEIEASSPSPSGPVGVATATGALIAWTTGDKPPVTREDGAPLPCSLLPAPAPYAGRCAVIAPAGEVLRFGEGTVTAGAAPGLHTGPVAALPGACGDARFPTSLAGGEVGCATAGALDRYWRDGRARPLPTSVAVDRASVSPDGASLVYTTASILGMWSPAGDQQQATRDLVPTAPPAASGDHVALAFPDRLQLARLGTGRRTQHRADRPVPALGGDWAAWSGDGLQLARLGGSGRGRLPAGTAPLVSQGWLVAGVPDGTAAWGLAGQLGWVLDLDTSVRHARALVDDVVALTTRGEHGLETVLIHLPTSLELARIGSAGRWALPRGADADGLLLHRYAPGTEGRLERLATPLRVLEEDGVLGLTGRVRAGGHGGRHRVLAPGERAEARVTVASPARLFAFRPDGPQDGRIRVTVGDRDEVVHPTDEGWVRLLDLPRWAEARVTFEADEDGAGFAIDALSLRRTGE